MRRIMIRILMVLAVMGASAVVTATPAQASESQCDQRGYFCVWEHHNFTGCFRKDFDHEANYGAIRFGGSCSGTVIDNRVTSVKNRGNSCNIRFYQFPNYSGLNMFLYREGAGVPYRDGSLSDGLSNDSRPFNDAISSHYWFC